MTYPREERSSSSEEPLDRGHVAPIQRKRDQGSVQIQIHAKVKEFKVQE